MFLYFFVKKIGHMRYTGSVKYHTCVATLGKKLIKIMEFSEKEED